MSFASKSLLVAACTATLHAAASAGPSCPVLADNAAFKATPGCCSWDGGTTCGSDSTGYCHQDSTACKACDTDAAWPAKWVPTCTGTSSSTPSSAAPTCSDMGSADLCTAAFTDQCSTDCYGESPAFTVRGCIEAKYCTSDVPAWATGQTCKCTGSTPVSGNANSNDGSSTDTDTTEYTSSFACKDYAEALHLVTKFYGAQRSGTVEQNWLLKLYPTQQSGTAAAGGVCFPHDGRSHDAAADYSGGWHDAGDYIKFTNNIAWAAYVLLKSYDAFPTGHDDTYDTGYGAADGIPDVLNEVKWATDYLLKIHDLGTGALVSQIGDYRDHNSGLTCPSMTTSGTSKGGGPRAVFFGASQTDTTQSKADVLATTAATLALMANLYAPFDPAYAATCTKHAKKLYATALTRPGTTAEAPGQNYYAHNSYKDDMACAAIELYRVTGTSSHGRDAVSYSKAVGNHNWVVDWSTHIDYCRHSIAVAGFGADVKAHWGLDISSYKNRVSSTKQHVKGLAFFGDWGSLRSAANAAFSAALYNDAFSDTSALDFARSQVDYILGNNEYKRSFIVGWGHNPPTRPHHKNAWGQDSWFDTHSVPLYSLVGALVGGPHTNHYTDSYGLTSPPGYQDIMTDYICNEVTLDYNAGLLGVLAAFASQTANACNSSDANTAVTTHTAADVTDAPHPSNPTTLAPVTTTSTPCGAPSPTEQELLDEIQRLKGIVQRQGVDLDTLRVDLIQARKCAANGTKRGRREISFPSTLRAGWP